MNQQVVTLGAAINIYIERPRLVRPFIPAFGPRKHPSGDDDAEPIGASTDDSG